MLNIVVFGLVYVGCAAAFYAYLLAEARPMPNMPDIRRPRFDTNSKRAPRVRMSSRHHHAT